MENQLLLQAAQEYHAGLPARIRQYLNARGISDLLVDFHLIGWNGSRITIPIEDRDRELAFFKLAKDPDDQGPSPKILATAREPSVRWPTAPYVAPDRPSSSSKISSATTCHSA